MYSNRCLIIEDDIEGSKTLCEISKRCGYDPDFAFDGRTGFELAIQNCEKYSYILLNLSLPYIKGCTILTNIRKNNDIPIIVISEDNTPYTKVDMLRKGADDYISKPFYNEEVAARIESVLRRYKVSDKTQILMYKDINMDLRTKIVKVNNTTVRLSVKEFKILKLFLSKPNHIFTKESIHSYVWKEEYYCGDKTINTHICNLRGKLNKANPNEKYIETSWCRGYMLA